MDISKLAQDVMAGNRRALARAITLIESGRDDHRALACALLEGLAPSRRQALRIGLSGTPGVGKSTFIESFGLMLTGQGPRVLEYNVRFGDPECQPLLMRLKSDLVDVIEATVDRRLEEIEPLEWDDRPSVCVVMASEGYPGAYEKGKAIRGLDAANELEDTKVFHAGTLNSGDEVVTDGGRVLGVTALGSNIPEAKLKAYQAVKEIRWDGAWCRKDISDKALAEA